MKRLLFIAVMVLGLSGCTKEPISKVASNNNSFDVELLFEADGCKVYRFYDGGDYHYFVKGGIKTISDIRYISGKAMLTKNDDIQTVGE